MCVHLQEQKGEGRRSALGSILRWCGQLQERELGAWREVVGSEGGKGGGAGGVLGLSSSP